MLHPGSSSCGIPSSDCPQTLSASWAGPLSVLRSWRREGGVNQETGIGPLGNKAKNGTLAVIGRNRFSTLVVNKVSFTGWRIAVSISILTNSVPGDLIFYPKTHQRKWKVIDLVHPSPFLSPPPSQFHISSTYWESQAVIKAAPYFLKSSSSKEPLISNRAATSQPSKLSLLWESCALHPSQPSLTPGFTHVWTRIYSPRLPGSCCLVWSGCPLVADKRGWGFLFRLSLSTESFRRKTMICFSHPVYELLGRRMVFSFLKLKSSRKQEGCPNFPTKNQTELSTNTNLEEPTL